MDFRPIRPERNYYMIHFHKKSKNAFISEITDKCKDKEDVETCMQKYQKVFDSVFETLKTKLEEEERLAYLFDKRVFFREGPVHLRREYRPTGYENWA
jgi:hypothetical protein